MERTEVLDMMSSLKLYGMESAYDETLATALKRKHEPQRFVGDLLKAEISEKQARSIKYQLTVAKLPLAKDVDDFAFKDTPIKEAAGSRSCWRWLHRPAAQRSERARRIWPSPSHEAASAPDRADASSQPSISSPSRRSIAVPSTSSRPKAAPDARAALPTTSHASTSSSSMNSAISPSASAGSTSAPRSSSPPTSPSAIGRADRKRYGTLLKEGGDQMNAGRPAATDRHGASRAVAERCATSLRRPTELDLGQLPRR